MLVGKTSKGGCNVNFKKVIRGRGAGVKKNLYCVDYKRNWTNSLSLVINLVKQPNKSAFISLIKYSNGTFSYILASSSLIPGDYTFTTVRPIIFSLKNGDMGCAVLLKYINFTHIFFNIELNSGCGGKYARSGGAFCKVISLNSEKDLIKIQLPSGVIKYLSQYCLVNLGRASNIFNFKQFFVKAGYFRNLGFKSKVRGVAMNPVDHPHGGRTKTNSPEMTPWGKIAKFNK